MKVKICLLIVYSACAMELSGCSLAVRNSDSAVLDETSKIEQIESEAENNSPVEVAHIRFFAWWWRDEAVRMGLPSPRPPKELYNEMNQWAFDHGEGGSVYPDNFDIVILLRNNKQEPRAVQVKMLTSFQLENISILQSEIKEDSTLANVKSEPVWTPAKEEYSTILNLSSLDSKEIVVKDYDFGNLLKKFYEKEDKFLPVLMKVRVVIYDQDNRVLTQRERTLDIILGD